MWCDGYLGNTGGAGDGGGGQAEAVERRTVCLEVGGEGGSEAPPSWSARHTRPHTQSSLTT